MRSPEGGAKDNTLFVVKQVIWNYLVKVFEKGYSSARMTFPEFNISYWILQTIAMMVTCFLIPRLRVSGPIPAFLTVGALAFVNSHLWSAALFFQIPLTFTSQTLMLFAANGIIFWVIVKVLPGIEVDGFLPALAAPIVFTICSVLIGEYATKVDWPKVWEQTYSTIEETRSYMEEMQSKAQDSTTPSSDTKKGLKLPRLLGTEKETK